MRLDDDPLPTAGPDKLTPAKTAPATPMAYPFSNSASSSSNALRRPGSPGRSKTLTPFEASFPTMSSCGFALLDNNEACLAPNIREGDAVDHERFFVWRRSIRRSGRPHTIGIGGTCVGKTAAGTRELPYRADRSCS